MTQSIDIPAGYKMTSLGVIPQEWEVKRLGEIGVFIKGKGVPKDKIVGSGNPCLTYGDIYTKYDVIIKNIPNFIDDQTTIDSQLLKIGDILFAGSGETLMDIGKCVAFIDNTNTYAGGDIIILRPSVEINTIALSYILNSERINKQKYQMGQGHSVVHIYPKNLEILSISLPPLPEQQKIAEILGVWDRGIEVQSRLVERLELRKRALMQRLLTARTRLKGFSGEWNETHIKDFSKEVSIRNKSNKDIIVLSCTKYDGLVPSLEYFGRKIFADDTSGYKVVHKNHFAYATNHIEEGSIGYQKNYDEALVSPMYTVFKTNASVNDGFLYTLFKSHRLIYQYNARMEGSIDRRGGLRWDSFSTIKIKLPAIAEQTAIAEILTDADREIALARAKLTTLRQQKKALMQQLLTGKIRVKI